MAAATTQEGVEEGVGGVRVRLTTPPLDDVHLTTALLLPGADFAFSLFFQHLLLDNNAVLLSQFLMLATFPYARASPTQLSFQIGTSW